MTEVLKEIEIAGKTFQLHKIPAVAGRRILSLYAPGEDGVVNTGSSQQGMMEAMKFVTVKFADGREIALETEALIDNHVPGAMDLLKLENAMLEVNFSS